MTERFIRRDDVLKMTGLSKSTLYRLIQNKLFPPSIQLSQRSVAWDQKDVLEWMEIKRSGKYRYY